MRSEKCGSGRRITHRPTHHAGHDADRTYGRMGPISHICPIGPIRVTLSAHYFDAQFPITSRPLTSHLSLLTAHRNPRRRDTWRRLRFTDGLQHPNRFSRWRHIWRMQRTEIGNQCPCLLRRQIPAESRHVTPALDHLPDQLRIGQTRCYPSQIRAAMPSFAGDSVAVPALLILKHDCPLKF